MQSLAQFVRFPTFPDPYPMLSEETHEAIINAYPYSKWQKLFDLIPLIERNQSFGYLAGGEQVSENSISMPYWVLNEVVDEFLSIAYKIPIVVTFDWPEWEEGRKIISDPDFDFDTTSVPAKCKLMTAIIRNDRFCEGALIQAFESGLMLRILKSIKRQVHHE